MQCSDVCEREFLFNGFLRPHLAHASPAELPTRGLLACLQQVSSRTAFFDPVREEVPPTRLRVSCAVVSYPVLVLAAPEPLRWLADGVATCIVCSYCGWTGRFRALLPPHGRLSNPAEQRFYASDRRAWMEPFVLQLVAASWVPGCFASRPGCASGSFSAVRRGECTKEEGTEWCSGAENVGPGALNRVLVCCGVEHLDHCSVFPV
jgi:hypothetical protein